MRITVVGLGLAGRTLHLPALQRLDGVEVVAAADPDPQARAGLGVPAFAAWREALAVPSDAVVVASPPETHAEIATAALEAGRHLYLEKPVATSLAEGCALAGRVPAGTVVQVGFAYRFHPLWQHIAALAAAGRLPGPWQVEARFTMARAGTGWNAPVIEVSCHHLDALSWLLGAAPVEIEAGASSIVARWPDGTTLAGTYTVGVPADEVVLAGPAGTVVVDRLRGTRLRGPVRRLRRAALPVPELAVIRRLRPSWERSFEHAFAAFRDGVRAGRLAPGAADLDAGLRAVAAAEAIFASIDRGRAVPVAAVARG